MVFIEMILQKTRNTDKGDTYVLCKLRNTSARGIRFL